MTESNKCTYSLVPVENPQRHITAVRENESDATESVRKNPRDEQKGSREYNHELIVPEKYIKIVRFANFPQPISGTYLFNSSALIVDNK